LGFDNKSRKIHVPLYPITDEEYIQYTSDLDSLKKWQSGVNKALWLIFGSIIAIGAKILFKV
jgi:hypothetical protein